MIPKIIHYCWFGPGQISDKDKACLESWKKFCPDYEIKLWNEDNYDVNKNQYMSDAYREKKWSFVSDYARLDVVYQYGGVYLDTDVELIQNIDDLMDNVMYCGFENDEYVAFGLGFGAEKGHPIIKEIMDVYETLSFYNPNGSLNLEPCPIYQSTVLKKHGIRMDNTMQNIDGVLVLPSEYFCPINDGTGEMTITDNTRSIHHFSWSWAGKSERMWGKISRWTNRHLGRKASMVICLPHRFRQKIQRMGVRKTIEFYQENYLRKRKKNRLAIVTLYGNCNYGNKLQNYAVEQIFLDKGIEVSTIDYRDNNLILDVKKCVNNLTNYRFAKNRKIRIAEAEKERLLKKFSDENLHVVRENRIERLKSQYDYFCVGSDQVWNPIWFNEKTKHLMLLDFVERNKKMTMSASFGIEELQTEWKDFFRERLCDFNKITVREASAEKIVKGLCDVSVDTYIDPTLMLGSGKWAQIAKAPSEYSEEYIKNSIVLYLLGDIDSSDYENINRIAEKNNLHIIGLNCDSVKDHFVPSLEQWIYCIGNARLVITDSFHGSVFSFLFDRNLIVYKRSGEYSDIFSRLQNLMQKFELEDRFVDVCSDEKIFEHDYTAGYRILENEREKMKSYIDGMI